MGRAAVTREEAPCASSEAGGLKIGGGGGLGRASQLEGSRIAQRRLGPCGSAATGGPMSRGTMPQPGAWPGASRAEQLTREAGAASPGPARAAAREGGKAAAGGQPRAAVRCPAEQ